MLREDLNGVVRTVLKRALGEVFDTEDPDQTVRALLACIDASLSLASDDWVREVAVGLGFQGVPATLDVPWVEQPVPDVPRETSEAQAPVDPREPSPENGAIGAAAVEAEVARVMGTDVPLASGEATAAADDTDACEHGILPEDHCTECDGEDPTVEPFSGPGLTEGERVYLRETMRLMTEYSKGFHEWVAEFYRLSRETREALASFDARLARLEQPAPVPEPVTAEAPKLPPNPFDNAVKNTADDSVYSPPPPRKRESKASAPKKGGIVFAPGVRV